MAPAEAVAPAVEEKQVQIINQGPGPLDTAHGRLRANSENTLLVPESVAKKLTGAYRFIKLVSDILPDVGGVQAKLEAHVKDLEALLKGAEAKSADLGARLQEFLGAESKKDLDALQEKHADALEAPKPAEPDPVAA